MKLYNMSTGGDANLVEGLLQIVKAQMQLNQSLTELLRERSSPPLPSNIAVADDAPAPVVASEDCDASSSTAQIILLLFLFLMFSTVFMRPPPHY